MADDNWYYAQNNQQLGPVTLEALRNMIAMGQVGATDLVWTQGMTQWLPARSVPEVASALVNRGGGVAGGGGVGGGATPGMSPMPGAGYVPPTAYPPQGGAPGPYSPVGYYNPNVPTNTSGKATAAMWLGIASLPLCLCPFVGIGLGIAAIVVGNGVPDGPDKSRAKTGVICGSIGLAIGILNAIAGVWMQFNK